MTQAGIEPGSSLSRPRNAYLFVEGVATPAGAIVANDPYWSISGDTTGSTYDAFWEAGIYASGSLPSPTAVASLTVAMNGVSAGKVTAKPGIVFTPTTTTIAPDTKGSVIYNSATDELNYYDGAWQILATGGGMSTHDMTGAYHSEDATGGAGNVIRASGATTFVWATLAHGDLSDAPTDSHHTEGHVLATTGPHTSTLPWSDLDLTSSSLVDLATRTHASLSDAPSDAHHTEAHVLASTGPHSSELPLSDLVAGAQGSIIRRGASDWEELALSVQNYVLKCGASMPMWGQVDWAELTSKPSTFSPNPHDLTSATHVDTGLTIGDVLQATGAASFAWQTMDHADLADAPTSAHHVKYLNSEAVAAVEAANPLALTNSLTVGGTVTIGSGSGSPFVYVDGATTGTTQGIGFKEAGTTRWALYLSSTTDQLILWDSVNSAEGFHVVSGSPTTFVLPSAFEMGGKITKYNNSTSYTDGYALVWDTGTTSIVIEQYAYGKLSGVPSSFTPTAHDLTSAYHTDSGLTVGHFLKALTTTTFGFAAHGLTASDVGAAAASHGSSAHSGDIIPGANQDLGTYYLDIDDIAVPSNPGSTIRRLFVNTATGKLSVRTNAGSTVSLEEQGGGVTFGTPTGNIDIGDGAVEGSSGDGTRADHQHQFSAPGAGYPVDVAATEADGSSTTPARSDHRHAHGSGYSPSAHHTPGIAASSSVYHTEFISAENFSKACWAGSVATEIAVHDNVASLHVLTKDGANRLGTLYGNCIFPAEIKSSTVKMVWHFMKASAGTDGINVYGYCSAHADGDSPGPYNIINAANPMGTWTLSGSDIIDAFSYTSSDSDWLGKNHVTIGFSILGIGTANLIYFIGVSLTAQIDHQEQTF